MRIRFTREKTKAEIWMDRLKVAGAVFILVAGLVGAYTLKRYPCRRYAAINHTEFDYSLWGGCLVKQRNGEWVPLDQIRGFVDGSR